MTDSPCPVRGQYTQPALISHPGGDKVHGETNDDINDHRGDVVALFVHLPYKAPPPPPHLWVDLSRRQRGGGDTQGGGGGCEWGLGGWVDG